MAMAVQNRTEYKNKSTSCTNCHKTGHGAETCFEIHGYPDWWGDRPRVEGKGSGHARGTSNGRGRGRGGRSMSRANGVQIGAASTNNEVKDSEAVACPGLSTKQWETLMQILNAPGGSRSTEKMNGMYSWIIDSGVTDHMTGLLEELCELQEITQVLVKLPDGRNVVAQQEGTIRFRNGFVFKRVLFVPGLECNLISVPQLLDHCVCFVMFTPNICVIQDRNTRMVIGEGKRRDGGLFYFEDIPVVQVFKTTTTRSFDIWHKRLGHPSLEVTKLLPEVSLDKNSEMLSQTCDVCHRAKQCRDKFPISENKVSSIFELVHCDLWGPYRHVRSYRIT
ncbi:retrovirus-related pol polyprotein from transposon TNT 1-94 [Tanacetum coccineum]